MDIVHNSGITLRLSTSINGTSTKATKKEEMLWDLAQSSVAGAQDAVYKFAKGSKKDFSQFIRHYNANPADYVKLNEKEVQALRKLREMWNQIGKNTGMDEYWKMSDEHSIVEGKLMKNSLWTKYVNTFLDWKIKMGTIMNFQKI